MAKSSKVVQSSTRYWEIKTPAELRRLFDERPYLVTHIRSSAGPQHLRTDYRDKPGMIRLGFTFVRSLIVISYNPRTGGSSFEMRVECKEGNLSREEALGEDWIPTPDEVWKQAAEIRKANDAAGLIRPSEFVGLDIPKTYCGQVFID